jgi:hypothetical protein
VARAGELDALAEGGDDGRLDPLEAMLEIESSDRRLEQSRKHVAAARDPFELVARDVARALREPLAETELLRDERARGARDDMRPDLREPPFRGVLEPVEDRARDRELEDAVAQELEPLVRVRALLRPGGMLEDLLEPLRRELGDQAAELFRRLRAGVR